MEKDLKQQYLQKANQADELARKAHDKDAQKAWEDIANNYRNLAMIMEWTLKSR